MTNFWAEFVEGLIEHKTSDFFSAFCSTHNCKIWILDMLWNIKSNKIKDSFSFKIRMTMQWNKSRCLQLKLFVILPLSCVWVKSTFSTIEFVLRIISLTSFWDCLLVSYLLSIESAKLDKSIDLHYFIYLPYSRE